MKVIVIGAGVSGLIAAYELERSGISPVILEAGDRVGGRIATDEVDGFLLDRGFQVLLTAYPEARRYLDYEALKLRKFDSGAIILKPGGAFTIHDPGRNPSAIFGMAFSPVGTLVDKLKIFKLNKELNKKTIDDIFESNDMSTMDFLKQYGFSEKIIGQFFKPFFSGVFLENDLNTSSRMFQFVFKMFGEGFAAIPEGGMKMIPEQLRSKLHKTDLRLNTQVEKIEDHQVILKNGEILQADKIIIACRPDRLLPQMQGQLKSYRSVYNLYFSLEKSFLAQPLIGLVTEDKFLINNIVFATDVSKTYSINGKALLSVSVVKGVENQESLDQLVRIELEALSGIAAKHFKHIKTYQINEALPDVEDMKADLPFTNSRIFDHIFLAGDYLLNGSVNAAMTSGRKAVEALLLTSQDPH
ncbi:protoporphyrinogen/coproporphyrinogen oxidase [Belliella marina]|uniref:Protoporphyrinogen/coproporphyrinogen oxidase n=1 Tax=Belliella marina TaxID=1644146 RepID=A0ABW4VPL6_9BACT